MMHPIPYGKQAIDDDDISAVVETLQSDYLTQGPQIAKFEESFAKYVDAKYAIAVSNGTAALHLSVIALGIEEDEYVICTPITFAASVNCVKYCGGQVIFADIDPETYLMDSKSVRSLINNNPDKKIRGIIPVDFAGRVPNLDDFRAIANEHNLWILEDACHAPGGHYFDNSNELQKSGNGIHADASIFSFHPVKHIATGEGGMITTNHEALYNKLIELRTHGITRNKNKFQNSAEFANGNSAEANLDYPGWYMEMQELGYNYRLTDIQAVLGSSQLKKASKGIERRRAIAKKYTEAFKNKPYIINCSGIVEGHAYHLFIIEVNDRRGLYDFLRDQKIYTQIHYIPVHKMPYYSEEAKSTNAPNSELYYSRCVSLPMFPTLKEVEQQFVIDQINAFYNE